MDIKALSRFAPRFGGTSIKMDRRIITTIILLALIVVTAFWFRSLPARFGELQAIDPFYLFRISEYVLENNWQMPELDTMRHHPFGSSPINSDQPMLYYLSVFMYTIVGLFGMSYLEFAILFPAIMGAIAVLAMFFLGREMFGTRGGLFAAFFLAVVPAFITRTSAGFFEKEGVAGVFIVLTMFFFVRAYNKKSWGSGILSGICIGALFQSWGGSQFFYLLVGAFVLIMLLLNRYSEGLVKAYVPLAVIGVAATQIFPFHMGIVGYPVATTIGVLSIIVIRFLAERFRLVKEAQLKYLASAITVVGIVVFLLSTMFLDTTYNILASLIYTLSMDRSVAATTVAEQMPGDWSAITGALGTPYSNAILPSLSFITPAFSLTVLMCLGTATLAYSFFRKREWIHILLLLWLFTSIISVFGMIRLLFLLGPPVALAAAHFTTMGIEYASKYKMPKNIKSLRREVNIISLPIVVLIILLLSVNLSNAYVYSNSMGPSFNQYWYEAMGYLAEKTPEDSNILSWWDFGYWFQTRGERPSVSDGGGAGPRYDIAVWFMNDASNWYSNTCGFETVNMTCDRWLTERYHVDYIVMDYTLPAKYGAISKIGSNDKATVGILQFEQSGIYPQGNKTIYEFKSGPYSIWIPFEGQTLGGTPMFLVSQGDQYISRAYVNDVCTTSGIIRAGSEAQDIGGCVAITGFGIFYVPEEAENNVFTNLMFMDGHGLPVEKVFENGAIRIYKVLYADETTAQETAIEEPDIGEFIDLTGGEQQPL